MAEHAKKKTTTRAPSPKKATGKVTPTTKKPSPKITTSPKSGATHTSKKVPRKAAPKKGAARVKGSTAPVTPEQPAPHRPVGCPPINDPNDVIAIEERITAFFDEVAAGKRKATFCGLALALGYSSRTSLWEHAKAREPISEPINTAMLMIEDRYEGKLDTANSYGAQFALQNRGWKTTQVLETENPSQTHVYLPENNRGRP